MIASEFVTEKATVPEGSRGMTRKPYAKMQKMQMELVIIWAMPA